MSIPLRRWHTFPLAEAGKKFGDVVNPKKEATSGGRDLIKGSGQE